MARAPFSVHRSRSRFPNSWVLWMEAEGAMPRRLVGYFKSAGDAIDHAYKNWPWLP